MSDKILLTEEDKQEIALAMAKLVGAMLTGKEVETSDVQVNITLPKAMVDTMTLIAERSGASLDQLLGELVSDNITNSLRLEAQIHKKPVEKTKAKEDKLAEQLEVMGLGGSKIQETLGKLDGLAKSLEKMQHLTDQGDIPGIMEMSQKLNEFKDKE